MSYVHLYKNNSGLSIAIGLAMDYPIFLVTFYFNKVWSMYDNMWKLTNTKHIHRNTNEVRVCTPSITDEVIYVFQPWTKYRLAVKI
jgi:hypothetical protein